jgi:hypothetical protein
MELTALLCNHAESINNLLYVSGGGIDRAFIPPGQPGPWQVSLALAVSVEVPWTQTNQDHSVHITLQDADGKPVEVQKGPAPEDRQQFAVDLRFNVGRPPQLEAGESQTVALAVNIPVLPFEKLGQYAFVISVDGTEPRRLHYRLVGQPGVTIAPGGAPQLL